MGSTELQELAILRQRLSDTEQELARAKSVIQRQATAIFNVDLKNYSSMKQLLTANDVFKGEVGHDPMRVNILEIMNNLRRFAKSQFESAGIIAVAPVKEQDDASHNVPQRTESPSQRYSGDRRLT